MMIPLCMLYLSRLGQLLRDQRGQAMLEYSTLTFFILGTAAIGSFAIKFPGQQVPLAEALYSALQVYVDGFYFSLHLIAP